MHAPGLDRDGFIKREGDLALVLRAFVPVVDAAKTAILDSFGPDRLHSGYLYGSISRGTATPGYPISAEAARATTANREALGMLIDDLGPWSVLQRHLRVSDIMLCVVNRTVRGHMVTG
jgi:hypothetical protein